jgi:sugar phosphate permease
VLVSLLWFQSRRRPEGVDASVIEETVSYRQSLRHVMSIKVIWLLAITQMCIAGSRAGLNGYLPLFLRDSGWTAVGADGTLTLLAAVSVVGVLPLSVLSDRLGLRKVIVMPAIIMMMVGVGLIAVFNDATVWVLVAIIGLAQEALAAGLITMVMETESIGATYAGSALGLLTTFAHLGNFFSPPAGNRLAIINPSLAFVFWSALALIALVAFYFTKETGWRKGRQADDRTAVVPV